MKGKKHEKALSNQKLFCSFGGAPSCCDALRTRFMR
jgi:hypothetical protein